jgi:signal transduction histidine kinase
VHPDPTIQDLLAKLADSICKQQVVIVEKWLNRVVQDESIPVSDRLTRRQIEDHIPELLERLAALLASPGDAREKDGADALAQSHGACRWQQGYDLAEFLRELAQFRAVLIQHIFDFEIEQVTPSTGARARAVDCLHLLLDSVISGSIKQFVGEQEARLRQHMHEVAEESEARLRLLRTVSHEVRNVLNAVSMAAQGLPEETDETLRNQMVMIVLRNVRHMRELLDQLLEVSSLIAERKASPPTRFNPVNLAQEIVSTYRPMAESKGLSMQSVVDPRLNFIESDELKIRQIASNLVSNALKYTDAGWIRLEFRVIDEECFLIMVEDSGAGMTTAESAQIFSEFYRIKRTAHQPGVGLGLAITKQLVGVLRGRIEVDSEPGRGSRFEVTLPRVHREVLLAAGEGL